MTCPLLHTDGCQWCGKPLKGRQTRWCSRKCSREHTANHRWTQAKALYKKQRAHYQCAICNEFFPDGDIHVDHIEPALGKHGTWGCHHHQTNLRILCIPCHKERTRQQHANGELRATNRQQHKEGAFR